MNPNIICEIGINHEGSVDKAIALLEDIAKNGLEYVKFQVWDEDYFDNDPCKDVFAKYFLNASPLIKLFHKAKELGLKWGASTFGDNATNFVLAQNPDFFKVASRRGGDEELEDYLAQHFTEKPILISTGKEDEWQGRWDNCMLWPNWDLPNAYLLHCVSKYPTPPEEAGLERLKHRYHDTGNPRYRGYSDHTEGTSAMIVAGILGAEWIEKHVCTSEQQLELANFRRAVTPDIVCSATPAQIKMAAWHIADFRRYL